MTKEQKNIEILSKYLTNWIKDFENAKNNIGYSLPFEYLPFENGVANYDDVEHLVQIFWKNQSQMEIIEPSIAKERQMFMEIFSENDIDMEKLNYQTTKLLKKTKVNEVHEVDLSDMDF